MAKTNAELAEEYDRSEDLSGFDEQAPVPVTVKRTVTISVRFSEDEVSGLRERAEVAGMKLTAFIRAAALEATSPVDRATLSELARDLERRAHDVAKLADRGVA